MSEKIIENLQKKYKASPQFIRNYPITKIKTIEPIDPIVSFSLNL